MSNILYQGAEAIISRSTFMEYPAVVKKRVSKRYRISEIDTTLISSRTREEAKLIVESRKCGVCVPIIYDIDLTHGSIIMEYLDGKRVKDIIEGLSSKEQKELCHKIGVSIARLHNNDIIHGDITTSNMILVEDHVHFIDFGLGCKESEIESKGVDLHVLMEAFESTHSQYPQCFSYVLEGYRKEYKENADLVEQKIDDIVRRGRYR